MRHIPSIKILNRNHIDVESLSKQVYNHNSLSDIMDSIDDGEDDE